MRRRSRRYHLTRRCIEILLCSAASLFICSAAHAAVTLHIASYRTELRAEQHAAALAPRMTQGFVYGADIPGKGHWYRVCIGRFETGKEAAAEIRRLRADGFEGYLGVVKLPEAVAPAASFKTEPLLKAALPEATPTTPAPPAPAGSEAPARKTRTLHLIWDSNPEPDLAGYRIYYDTKPGPPYRPAPEDVAEEGAPPISLQPGTTELMLHGLNAGKTYYLSIKALNRAGVESPFSRELVAPAKP